MEKSTGGAKTAMARAGAILRALRRSVARSFVRNQGRLDEEMTDRPGNRDRSPRRRRIALLVLILAGAGGLVFRGALAERRAPSELTPQTALFYLEVRDPIRVLEGLRSTRIVNDLRIEIPHGGVLFERLPRELWEWGWLARSPMALVVTGMDWEGETVRPHLALLWTTTRSEDALRRFAETHAHTLASRAYGTFTIERSSYEGKPIVGYRAHASGNGFFWSVCAKTLIVATHPDVLRAIIETARGRRPSLETHPRLHALRRAVEHTSNGSAFGWRERERQNILWGWASGEALALGARAITASPLQQDLMRAVLKALSFNVAFAVEFDGGEVVTRYILDLDETWVKRYDPILRPNASSAEDATLRLIPRRIRHFTLYRWTDARALTTALEETLGASLPEPLRLILAGTLARMRQALGWDPEETVADALGSTLAVVDTGDPTLLLLISARNAPKLAALIGKHFKHMGARVRETSVRGISLFASEAHPERAFAFLDGHLLIGHPKQIEQVLLARERRETVDDDSALRARLTASDGFEITVTFEQQETVRAFLRAIERMERMSSMAIRAQDAEAAYRLAAQWPPSIRVSSLRPEGLWSESRSLLGPLAFLLQVIEEGEG